MNGNTIRTITIMGKAEGLDKLTADINKLAAAEQNVAVVSEQSAKGMLTLEQSMAKLERRFVDGVRAQQDYEKIQRELNRAVEQNPELQARADKVLAAVNERYNQGTVAQKAFANATSGVQGQLLALSAGAGPVGVFLSSLGPWGMAAAAGLGAVSAVFNRIVEGADRIGDKSIELRKFSDVTGLTVQQIKGLTQTGARLGVGSEEIESSLERFSVGLNEARKGTGSLYEQVRAINPELAKQLALAPNAAKAWDILAQAIQGATDASQRNALARASFGRGGIETGLVAVESATKGGIDNLAKANGLTKEWVDETARLRKENIELEKSIKNMTDAAFALPMLEAQNKRLKIEKQITEELLKRRAGENELAADAFKVAAGRIGGRRAREAQGVPGPPRPEEAASVAQFKLDPETLAGWQQLEDAMGAVVLQSDQVVTSLKQQQDAAASAANEAKERVGYLGAAATEQEKLNAKTLELDALLINNTINQETYNRALGAAQFAAEATIRSLQDQNALIQAGSADEVARLQAAQAYRDIAATTNDFQKAAAVSALMLANSDAQRARAQQTTMVALQGQLSVAQAGIGLSQQEAAYAQAQAQYEATINNLVQQRVPLAEALLQADLQRQIAMAQIVKAEEDASNQKREQLKAARDLADTSVFAKSVAEQNVQRNKEITEDEQAGAAAAQERAQANRAAANQLAREAADWERIKESNRQLIEMWAFIPFGLKTAGSMSFMGGYTEGKNIFQTAGGYSQFKPGGYESTSPYKAALLTGAISRYGVGGFTESADPMTGAPIFTPNAQGLERLVNAGGGSMGSIISGLSSKDPQQLSATAGLLSRITNLLPESEKPGAIQQQLEMLKGAPPSLARDELVKQLNDQLQQLADATKENTDATSAMTDVLSPFYSSDPRQTHLGFRAFARGGIMTEHGELPLRHYQGGGMATSPQVAVFGEGATPEAYVPVPAGRIPVEIRTPANSNQRQRPVVVNINVMGNADSGTVAALRSTSFQQAQAMRRMMR